MRAIKLTRFFISFLLACGLVGIAATPAWSGDIRTERIHFQRGEIGATIKGRIKGYHSVDYKLRARAGQFMNVGLRSDNSSNYFNVMAPGETDVAFFIGSTEGNEFEGDLSESGDYAIRVYLMRNAARRGETANYTLEVAIAAAGDVPSEADGREGRGHSVGGARQMDPSSLLDMRGRNLDGEMGGRGFTNVGGYKSDGASMTTWWNADSRQCISVETREGRIAKAETVVEGNCL